MTSPRQWRLSGSRAGLLRFAELADHYASDPELAGISEHRHYGPHMDLEFMTWETPNIDEHAIRGSQTDIKRLADLVRQQLDCSQIGHVMVIGEEYAENCPYTIALRVNMRVHAAENRDSLRSLDREPLGRQYCRGCAVQ